MSSFICFSLLLCFHDVFNLQRVAVIPQMAVVDIPEGKFIMGVSHKRLYRYYYVHLLA
jgi:hypothetical protein